MKNISIVALCALTLTAVSCGKDKPSTNTDGTVTEQQVLTDFANVVVNPDYQDIQAKAAILNTSIQTLNTSTTDANLAAAQKAWKDTRAAWESCEGFLFGPVEDNSYDPTMDDWPVNKVDLDALINSNNPLQLADIDPLETTLKGFHAIEYVIFGVGGTRKASDITAREKLYVVSLAQSLYNTTTQLRNSWDPASGNYTAQVVNAGNGSTRYTTRKAVFVALVGSMADICNEVANEKMQTPLTAKDSTLDESSFSHNSVTDFKNNITGVLNAYKCQYGGVNGSHSLSQLVASKNAALDSKIQSQINAAIASFSGITTTYEKAIYSQPSQIKAVQNAINALKATLDPDGGELSVFINTYIKD